MAASAQSREGAARNDRQKRRLERIGVLAARQIGTEMLVGVLNRWRGGPASRATIPDFIAIAMAPLAPLIAEGNTAAHLTSASTVLNDALPVIDRLRLLAFGPYEGAIDVAVARMNLSADQVAAIAADYGDDAIDVVRAAAEPIQRRMRQAVAVAVERNVTVPEGAAILRNELARAGVSVAGKLHLFETLFRTQIGISYGAGRWQMNEQPVIRDILWGYEYVTAGDDRVRPNHDLLDGVSLPKESPRWSAIFPPNGFNCRCDAIEIYKDETDLAVVSDVPPPTEVDGVLTVAGPDPGFAFNPANVVSADLPGIVGPLAGL